MLLIVEPKGFLMLFAAAEVAIGKFIIWCNWIGKVNALQPYWFLASILNTQFNGIQTEYILSTFGNLCWLEKHKKIPTFYNILRNWNFTSPQPKVNYYLLVGWGHKFSCIVERLYICNRTNHTKNNVVNDFSQSLCCVLNNWIVF